MEGRGDVAPADCRNVTPVDCRDVTPADCGDAVARDRRHLREALCPPQGQDPAEGDGCRLCPPGWTRRGRKCYWVADGAQSWNKSRKNCTSRDAELLMPEDCDELLPCTHCRSW
ncbi:killer cell lectin-like receptor subfamily G member 1 [Apteryx rowi]|uniref:killer cell lectin-like receptor subfamily G member 1 n=1 Tax=Apteryx rowi TaxID=308060 RepID=UPI000E1D3DBE|nr:killer cell lectin-like receptor subfamily G member 1 [Apteryx rowi]